MRINFVTDDKLRNLALIYAAFQYPKDEIIDMSHLKAESKFKIDMLKSKLLNKPSSILIFKEVLKGKMNDSKFLIWLSQLLESMPSQTNDIKKIIEFESELKTSVKENNTSLAEFSNSVYGFDMPKNVIILLSNRNNTKSGKLGEIASMLIDTPPLIHIDINAIKQAKEIPLIDLMHESLHAIIYEKKLFNYKVTGTSMFEELLIRYTTEGMLVNRLKLNKHESITECYDSIVSSLNGSKTMALRIKNLMEKYNKEYGKRTIWAVISETSFKRSFNRFPPKIKKNSLRT